MLTNHKNKSQKKTYRR